MPTGTPIPDYAPNLGLGDAMRLAILDDYQGVALGLADWGRLDAEIHVFTDHLDNEDALVERLAPFDILCLMRERTPMPRALMERLPNLKLLVTGGMRNAAIDVAAAADNGVLVSGTSAAPAPATAELTLTMILALARGLMTETRSVRAGGWQVKLGRDARGATLGIVGLGKLGGEVARLAQAFGMEIIAWSENLTDERAAEVGVTRVGKAELFERADFITIHMVLSDRSRGLVGAEDIARMKPDAYLVNTSRGPIIDMDALVAALLGNRIAGAALDVYEEEPLPADDLLRSMENVLATPHIGFVTRETYQIMYPEITNSVEAFLNGDPVRLLTP